MVRSEVFWDDRHKEGDPGWLTLSHVGHYLKFFELDGEGRDVEGKAVLEIGVGQCIATKGLKILADDLWAVDVAPTAIERAGGITGKDKSIHVNQTDRLPADHFDLAFSYVVTQHLRDPELEHQMAYVLRALKPGGVFMVQFLTEEGSPDGGFTKAGASVSRTPAYFQQIVEAAGGGIIKWVKPLQDEKRPDIQWNGCHVRRRP